MGAAKGRGLEGTIGGLFGGRASGIPMPIAPTENVGIMSGAIRKKTKDRRRDERGSRRGRSMIPDLSKVPVSRRLSRGEERFGEKLRRDREAGITRTPEEERKLYEMMVSEKRRPRFDPNKPSAVMETERVNVQDPTLGGLPEREVPMPKERDTSPRGPAPFSPDERAMARDAFFEKMFSRADERSQQKAMRKEERMNTIQSMRDEDRNKSVDRRRGEVNVGGEINLDAERGRGRRGRGGRRMRRRDFTRRRSQMEGRRSREERAAFRDRFVSTLR